MAETAAPIGLSWAPKLPSLATTSGGSRTDPAPKPSTAQGSLWKPTSKLVDGLYVPPRDPRKVNKLARKNVKDTSGKGWFDMPAPTITPELKKDLEILQLRHVMDPKRHFKRAGKSKALPKYFQVGTIVEPASEFYSGRLTKRERKQTLVEELLSDQYLKSYRKRKVREIQESRTPGGNQKWKNKGKQTLKRAKDRRKYNCPPCGQSNVGPSGSASAPLASLLHSAALDRAPLRPTESHAAPPIPSLAVATAAAVGRILRLFVLFLWAPSSSSCPYAPSLHLAARRCFPPATAARVESSTASLPTLISIEAAGCGESGLSQPSYPHPLEIPIWPSGLVLLHSRLFPPGTCSEFIHGTATRQQGICT